MRVVDELLAFLRSRLRIRLLVMILGIKIFEMRIFTSETNDEVVMRSGSRRKERTDQVLEQSIAVESLAPAVDGSIFQVLHKDERADQNSGINSRPTVSRVKRAEKIRNEARVELPELMKSRTKQRRIQTFELRRI